MIRAQIARLLSRPVDLQTYCWILCRAGVDGVCYGVSRRRLAADIGAGRSQVGSAVARLADLGMISVSGSARTAQDIAIVTARYQPDTCQGSPINTGSKGKTPARYQPDIGQIGRRGAGAALLGDSTEPDTCQGSPINTGSKGKTPARYRPDDGLHTREYNNTTTKKDSLASGLWELSEAYVADSKKRVPGAIRSLTDQAVARGAEALDKLVRIEGYDLEAEIKPTLRWARKDPFWARNLLSLGSLRKRGSDGLMKYEQIRARMMSETQTAEHPGAREMIPESVGCTLEEWQQKTGGRNSIRL
jgi:hypothetical protein